MVTATKLNTIFASAPFDPRSIAGLKLWLAADRITGLADGDPVGTWGDISGRGNHLTQASAPAKPLFKTGLLNGKPVLRFDGSDDYLRAAFTLAQPEHVFIVFKHISLTDARRVFTGDSNNDGILYISTAATSTNTMYAGAGAPSTVITAGTFRLVSCLFSGTSSAIKVNNGSTTTGNSGTASMDGFSVGGAGNGSAFSNIEVAEILIYSAPVADASPLRSYFNSKYQLF